jgi:integrase
VSSAIKFDLKTALVAPTIADQGNTVSEQGGATLARRRYQRGSLILKKGEWIGRWREDEVRDGQVVRRRKYEVLGTTEQFATRSLAKRALQERISFVNSLKYRAKTALSFREFAQRWQDTVMVQHKPSTRSTVRSHIRKYLVPAFGKLEMSELGTEGVQSLIAGLSLAPKTVRNIFITLQLMWKSAKSWGYVSHGMDGIVLPKARRSRRRFYTIDELRRILGAAQDPNRTFYWLAAETGMRAGELCGLRTDDIDLNRGVVKISQSAWHGKLQDPKSENSVRTFAISTRLRDNLRCFLSQWRPNQNHLVFASRNGTPWDANLLVKRKLRPLLLSLCIEGGGLHGFRHGNASLMDLLSTPMKVRQERLGHSDPRLTMNVYTHMASADDERIAEQLGDLLVQLDAVGQNHVLEGVKEKGPALQQALVN